MAETDETKSYLYRIAYQSQAAVKLADLPRIWGLPEAEAAAVLADLLAAGLVDLWPERKALVLSMTAAHRLSLELVCDSRQRLMWYDRGSPSAERAKQASGRTVKRPKQVLESELAGDDGAFALDDLPGPTSCELVETTQPTLLYASSMIWPGPSVEPKRGQRCKGCGHIRKMPSIGFCLACCRSGNRNLRTPVVPSVPAPNRVKQGDSGEKAPARSSPLDGGVEARPRGRKKARKVAVKDAI